MSTAPNGLQPWPPSWMVWFSVVGAGLGYLLAVLGIYVQRHLAINILASPLKRAKVGWQMLDTWRYWRACRPAYTFEVVSPSSIQISRDNSNYKLTVTLSITLRSRDEVHTTQIKGLLLDVFHRPHRNRAVPRRYGEIEPYRLHGTFSGTYAQIPPLKQLSFTCCLTTIRETRPILNTSAHCQLILDGVSIYMLTERQMKSKRFKLAVQDV